MNYSFILYIENLNNNYKFNDYQMEFSLKENQKQHVVNLINILKRNLWAIDLSVMGSGKTFTSSYIAKYFKFTNVVIVCPVSVQDTWYNMKLNYKLPIFRLLSYETLRGNTETELKHGLLIRNSEDNFSATPLLEDLIKTGTLFIFDEFQKTKNITFNHYAIQTIIWSIENYKNSDNKSTKSRILLLSGTPFDKKKQVVDFLRMVGVIRHRNLYDKLLNKRINIQGFGLEQLIHFCLKIDYNATVNIINTINFSTNEAHNICFILYTKIIQKHLTSTMSSPVISVDIDIKNGYYNISSERTMQYKQILDYLLSENDFRLSKFNNYLYTIEHIKIEIFVRETYNILNSIKNAKVVIFFNFKNTLKIVSSLLSSFNPLVLEGDILKKDRIDIIKQFQEKNTKHRLLLSNLVVGSLGIDLDDTEGNFPRYVFISPNFNSMAIHQATHRFYRTNTKSTPHIRIVYIQNEKREDIILNILDNKKTVLKETLQQQLNVIFPGEYEEEIITSKLIDIKYEIPPQD